MAVGAGDQNAAFRRWFTGSYAAVLAEGSNSRDALFRPQRMYHTTRNGGFDRFEIGRTTSNSGTFGSYEVVRHAIFVTPSVADSNAYGKVEGAYCEGAATMPVYVRARAPLDMTEGASEEDFERLSAAGMSDRFIINHLDDWSCLDGEEGAQVVSTLKGAGYDSLIFLEENPDTGGVFETWALFSPSQLAPALLYPDAERMRFLPNSQKAEFNSLEPAL